MSDPELKTIRKSNKKNKKYMVNVDGKWIHFGDKRYSQYKDQTPLKLYSKLDHLDEIRRLKYFIRHGYTNNKMSPKYWSNNYLW